LLAVEAARRGRERLGQVIFATSKVAQIGTDGETQNLAVCLPITRVFAG
jgi:hypothetical protein